MRLQIIFKKYVSGFQLSTKGMWKIYTQKIFFKISHLELQGLY